MEEEYIRGLLWSRARPACFKIWDLPEVETNAPSWSWASKQGGLAQWEHYTQRMTNRDKEDIASAYEVSKLAGDVSDVKYVGLNPFEGISRYALSNEGPYVRITSILVAYSIEPGRGWSAPILSSQIHVLL